MQKCILVITDGIGINKENYYNAFMSAAKPNYKILNDEAKFCTLKTSGKSVGLPDGVIGNSEVGHMTIGSGRIIYQNLVRINNAIEDKSIYENDTLNKFISKFKRIHVIGLYSDGGVHSSYEHFNVICEIVSKNSKCFAHIITDGRDVLPQEFYDFYEKNPSYIKPSSISGRFYAMDRDNNLDRTRAYIDMLFNEDEPKDMREIVLNAYKNNITDEFIEPTKLDTSDIKMNDGVIIVNFRSDRARQLAKELQVNLSSEQVLCMCEYDEKLNLDVIFPKVEINNTLAEILSQNNLKQFHTAETEKYAHVSFFFNGGVEKEFKNEARVLVPSPKVKSYAEMPEMSAYKVCDCVLKAIDDGYDFIVVNFANGDMVGHTGDYNAAIKAVESVDYCLGKIMLSAKNNNYALLITSDHGNCEAMRNKEGKKLTNHTTFDVGCWLYNYKKDINLKNGSLANVAASVLKILDLEKPKEMEEALF
ncbi:2,3-bisphosphoglycerate-independent phosphoglycerate mutase [Campylobacter sp. MG1]|uniref:2,3-bisphosphoglycerate-independent phosphoglycerate mutase n=1 Tax=Campylobacter sp. MG1 TaxID=2976332 RepID=UPI00226CC73E|nr:2,3-bisphosphoglycerate-independent phosphoglycerate mutase [Campylobacter sp. MG1]